MKKFERKYLYKTNMKIFKKILNQAGGISTLAKAIKKIEKEGTSLASLRYVIASERMSPQLAVILEKFMTVPKKQEENKASDRVRAITRKDLLPNLFKSI